MCRRRSKTQLHAYDVHVPHQAPHTMSVPARQIVTMSQPLPRNRCPILMLQHPMLDLRDEVSKPHSP